MTCASEQGHITSRDWASWRCKLERPAGEDLQARALTCDEGFPKRVDGRHCSNACTATLDEAVLPLLVVPAYLLALRNRHPATCDLLMAFSGAKACCNSVYVVLSSNVLLCIPFHIKPMSIFLMLHMSLLLLLAALCCA